MLNSNSKAFLKFVNQNSYGNQKELTKLNTKFDNPVNTYRSGLILGGSVFGCGFCRPSSSVHDVTISFNNIALHTYFCFGG